MERQPSTSILFFLGIVGLTLFGLGWAIDNGFSLPEPEKLVASLASLKELPVSGSPQAQAQVMVPNVPNVPTIQVPAPAPKVVVVPNTNQPIIAPAARALGSSPTVTPYIPPAEPTIAITNEPAHSPTIIPTQQVITITPTQQVITVTATYKPIVIVTATANQPNQSANTCTTAMVGIACGAPAVTATPLPTALPNLDAHGLGGARPLGPTPEAVEVKPPAEVEVPASGIYTLLNTEMWGDLTVRSTWDGQQAGVICYSSKYGGQTVTCPPPETLATWKTSHQITIPTAP